MKQWNATATKRGRSALLLTAFGALALLPALSASAAERSLAGIKIFSTTRPVLAKYGSPTQVIVGRPSLTPTGGAAAGAQGGQPGAPSLSPGALPGFGAAPPELGGGGPGFGGGSMGGGPGFGGGGRPGFGGGGQTGAGSQGGLGQNGTGAAATDPSSGEVTWIYDRPGGSDLEFTFSSDGRVVQIRATGYQGPVKTAKGIGLGAKYGAVIAKYNYPETQEQDGSVLTARYTERSHAAFQFYNQRVVAIIVAAVE